MTILIIMIIAAIWISRLTKTADRIANATEAVAVIAALALTTSAMAGEQSRFYDSRGNSVGTATRDSQGTTTFRDSRGSITSKEYRR